MLSEPPWYVIRMPGGVGGGSREATPYPDSQPVGNNSYTMSPGNLSNVQSGLSGYA